VTPVSARNVYSDSQCHSFVSESAVMLFLNIEKHIFRFYKCNSAVIIMEEWFVAINATELLSGDNDYIHSLSY
jgi:hypothetical protein